MNKNDFRVQFPLWNITLLVIFMVWIYGVIYFVDMSFGNFADVFEITDDKVVINWNIPGLLALILGFILIIAFFIAYSIKLKRHNRDNPDHKMNALTFIKPGEFLEDDEMLRLVTQKATKKVYVLYSQFLPLVIFLMVIPLHRYVYIFAVFLLLIIHNALYYGEIRKYVTGVYNFNAEMADTKKTVKNKRFSFIIPIVAVALMLTFGAGKILQIQSNSKENMQKSEACLHDGGTVVVTEGNGLFSLTSVTCERR